MDRWKVFRDNLTIEIILQENLNRSLQNCGAVFEGKGTEVLKAMSMRGIDMFVKQPRRVEEHGKGGE